MCLCAAAGQVAFLASVVSPKVAAAAAQRALEALAEDDPAAAAELNHLTMEAEATAATAVGAAPAGGGSEGGAPGQAAGDEAAGAPQPGE
jgi:hypothetical protein